jgi:hypothetical protein
MSLLHQLVSQRREPPKKGKPGPKPASAVPPVSVVEPKAKASRKRAIADVPEQGEQMVAARMTKAMVAALDEWAARQEPRITRSTAIRHLIERGIT